MCGINHSTWTNYLNIRRVHTPTTHCCLNCRLISRHWPRILIVLRNVMLVKMLLRMYILIFFFLKKNFYIIDLIIIIIIIISCVNDYNYRMVLKMNYCLTTQSSITTRNVRNGALADCICWAIKLLCVTCLQRKKSKYTMFSTHWQHASKLCWKIILLPMIL